MSSRKQLMILFALPLCAAPLLLGPSEPSSGEIEPIGLPGTRPENEASAAADSGPLRAQQEETIQHEAGPGFFGAPAGSRFVYRFTRSQDVQLSAQGQQGQRIRLGDSGSLAMTIVARREGEIAVAWEFAELDSSGQRDGQARGRFAARNRELETTTNYLLLATDGAHLGFRFDDGLGLEGRQWLRSVAANVQFVVPSEQRGASWNSEESDLAGRWQLRYRWADARGLLPTTELPEGRVGALRREKRAFEPRSAAAGQREVVLRGASEARLGGPLRWLGGVRADEQQDAELGISGGRARARLRFDLELTAATSARVDAEFDWSGAWSGLDAEEEAEALRRAQERRLLEARFGNLRLETAVHDVLAAFRAEDPRALFRARHVLMSLLRLRPEELEKLAAMLLGLPEREGGLLVMIAGASDTPESEVFLNGILGQRGSPLRQAALYGLFQRSAPQGETARNVLAAARETGAKAGFRNTALLLLGKLGGRMEETRDQLLGLEGEAVQQGRLVVWLDALANGADPAAEDVAVRYLGDERIEVREAAAHLLGKMPGTGASRLLSERYAGEESEVVRGALALALSQRGDEVARSACAELLASEKSKRVRGYLLRGLWDQGNERARRLVRRAAASDPSPELREFAQSLLQEG